MPMKHTFTLIHNMHQAIAAETASTESLLEDEEDPFIDSDTLEDKTVIDDD